MKRSDTTYTMEARDCFFDATRSIVEHEIRPGNTVSFMSEVDLTEVEIIRAQALAHGRRKPTYTAFVVKAVALAIQKFPYANRRVVPKWFLGRYRKARLQKFHHADIGVACERWLSESASCAFMDNLRDADQRSLAEITEWLVLLSGSTEANNDQWRTFKNLIERCPTWLSTLLIRMPVFSSRLWVKYRGAAAMISSPAKYGVDGVVGTWTAPLGISFGLVKARAVVRNGNVVARPTFMLSLNFDRRVMAGAQAAKFFHRIVEILEKATEEILTEHAGQKSEQSAPQPVDRSMAVAGSD